MRDLRIEELARFVFGGPDVLRVAFWAALTVVVLAAVGAGVALVRGGRSPDALERAARLSRLPLRVGVLAILLTVLAVAARGLTRDGTVAALGANVTPADVAADGVYVYLALGAGVLVGTLGILVGWTLEWLVEGRRLAAGHPD